MQEADFSKLLAKSYKLPLEVMTKLLELWNPRTHAKFDDFVEEMKREANNERLRTV